VPDPHDPAEAAPAGDGGPDPAASTAEEPDGALVDAGQPDEGEPPGVAVGLPAAPPAFCLWCGRPSGTGGDCADAGCRRELDPPRFCPTCGRRLRVQVAPTGVTASCRDHGPVVPPT
jgi:hypothetical protein